LAARGYRTVIPDYRLYPDVRFPAFMEDAALAYRWAAQAAGDEPIVLAGHSAGGHVAALLALDGRWIGEAPRPAGVVGLAGPYAFDPTTWPSTKDIFAPAAAHPDSARPVAFVTPQSPPMLLTRGAEDDVVAPYNAEELAKALTAAGVPVENKLYPGLGHVALILAFARPLRWRAPALEDALAFIGQVTGNITAPR
jgi:acetyl esterase/lipase